MIDVHLEINGRYFTPLLSTYRVTEEIKYQKTITTMDGTEHYFGKTGRDIIRFSLLPHTDFSGDDFDALQEEPLNVEYDHKSVRKNKRFALASNLDDVFLLDSVDGIRRYIGGEIVLRALEVNGGA